MKNVNSPIKVVFMSLLLSMVFSCKKDQKTEDRHSKTEDNNAKLASIEFKNVNDANTFEHYIEIKNALVGTDAAKAKKAAARLIEVANNNELKEAAAFITLQDEVEKQREAFIDVTAQMEKVVKSSLSSGKVYKQFCPMAFDNTGGFWLSTEKEIKNPYFGDRMLKCGVIKETIK